MPSFENRLCGGLYGLLVGDALGVPYEFKAPSHIPAREHIEFTPPSGYPRTYPGIAPGTWSDDGAQALALLDSLLTCGQLDLNHVATNFADWRESGRFAVGSLVFDIGITTSRAIDRFLGGSDASTAGPRDPNSNGNGALMRVLPLALWHKGSDAELVNDALAQSLVTHGHERSQVCCALYCLWARSLLRGTGSSQAWSEALEKLQEALRSRIDGFVYESELETHVRPQDFAAGSGSGYVVDSLRSARWVMQEDGYENVVKAAVALGHDTDTTACIAGGVAGVREGVEAIPSRWREALRGQDILTHLLSRLLAWHEQ